MRSRIKDKEQAIKMRKEGFTQPEIVCKLNVSKGSVSKWVKNVPVPYWYHDKIQSKRMNILYDMIQTPEWREKMRQVGIKHRKQPLAIIKNNNYYTCNNCKQTLKSIYFGKRKNRSHSTWCLDCMKNYCAITRAMVINKLGGICNNCKCSEFKILELHHINCNGIDERKELSNHKLMKKIYNMPIENSKKEYEILCKICHTTKHIMIKYPNLIFDIKFKIIT